jgi:hypothetical protein
MILYFLCPKVEHQDQIAHLPLIQLKYDILWCHLYKHIMDGITGVILISWGEVGSEFSSFTGLNQGCSTVTYT